MAVKVSELCCKPVFSGKYPLLKKILAVFCTFFCILPVGNAYALAVKGLLFVYSYTGGQLFGLTVTLPFAGIVI